jgi:glycosyltransferase involved in cell wall biosynthesis
MLFIYRYLVPFPNPKAHSIQIANTIHALARAGAEVMFYPREYTERSPEECLGYYGLQAHPNLKLCSHPRWTKRSRKWKGTLIRLWERWMFGRLRNRRPVFYLRDGEDSFVYARKLAQIRERWNATVIIENHRVHKMEFEEYSRPGAPEHERVKLKGGLRRLSEQEGEGLRACDGLTPISETLMHSLIDTYGDLPPMEVVHSGAAQPEQDDPPLHARKGIVYAGQLYAWKGVPNLIAAMADVSGAELTIVGGNKTEELDELRALATQHRVQDRIRFVGHVPHPEVHSYVSRARCAVIPLGNDLLARKFTSPIKVFEYMAAGTPIVAANLPTIREILQHEQNALLFEPDNPRDMADKISRVMSDAALADRLRDRAKADLAAYSWDARAKKIIAFARRLQGAG